MDGTRGFASLDDEDVRLASRGINHDGDGDVDILANTYRLNRNLYYRNDGDGDGIEAEKRLGWLEDPTDGEHHLLRCVNSHR